MPVPGSHATPWHWSLAGGHVTGLLPVQTPDWHVSVCVHAFPSLQLVPLLAFGFEHRPVLVLQVPATWHWSLAVHTTGLLPVHTPVWHVSVCVHEFPSLQAVPLAAFGFEHAPVVVLHTPAVWHWSLALRTTGLLPVHTPAWQVSVCVHAFPSLQVVIC